MSLARSNGGEAAVNELEGKAEEAARLMSVLSNPKRLLALCQLVEGEKAAGRLADMVGLSPAALSQHLALMRAMNIVGTRRDGATVYYRLASPEARAVLETLYRVYCEPDG
ncbi:MULTISPECIES: metalloregulator ArsR/SmtB family transcription factor [unclassified Chelatococcus]|uniref:ArsR/SmtB family transcription factor n=1 Tax=unclassified Chelatococcus TaxID=2638111 RepID=UPI001BCF10FC|nr:MULTISPECIES: metalloregulator ArsR/SmtB family transcription factor [unclassified Chelatococcus]MBS7743248.1 helix-turn-helix transcriptional regulator [Chelatococcus sp. HY11]MBX3541634.1 helix-turn-helix transcriptional regulator [Chelatococcus sp.]MCO5074474.1 metalloregulator ArsR/SmtB family transcription factor [Chelatococcus sp.]